MPAPGFSGTHEWTGWVAADALPQAVNPASGYVVSANQKLVGDDYPFFLTLEWADGFRARRIADVIRSKPRHTRRDFEVLQNDLVSLPAQQMVSYFSVLNPENPWERTALRQLADGNYRTDRDTAGAAASFVYRVFAPDHRPAMPRPAQQRDFAQQFSDGLLFAFPKSRGSVARDFKWLGSYRYGIVHLGGRDGRHLRRRCEEASELLGWPAPYAGHEPEPVASHDMDMSVAALSMEAGS